MSELKPCPFCGGDKAMAFDRTCDRNDKYDPADRAFPIVRCMTCFAEVPGENWGHIRTAITAWNRRTPSTTGDA